MGEQIRAEVEHLRDLGLVERQIIVMSTLLSTRELI
jgi:hypothetical protein